MSAPLLFLALTLARPGADTSMRLPRNGTVEIDSRTRDIVLHTGPGDMVTVRGASADFDGGTLQIDDISRRSRSSGGAIDITVPEWSRVEISSIGGNVTLNGTPDRLHAETVNGFIHVNGGSGALELESVAGAVVVNDFRGTRLSIDATGENVTVTGAVGTIEADNVNGDVVLRGIRSSAVTAGSINGAVSFEGALAPGGSYEFTSQNSDVTLTLPANVSARMHVSSMNGALKTDIPATTNGQTRSGSGDDDEHDFTVVYGGGSARVSVDVFNGNVIVKRKTGP